MQYEITSSGSWPVEATLQEDVSGVFARLQGPVAHLHISAWGEARIVSPASGEQMIPRG